MMRTTILMMMVCIVSKIPVSLVDMYPFPANFLRLHQTFVLEYNINVRQHPCSLTLSYGSWFVLCICTTLVATAHFKITHEINNRFVNDS